MTTGREAELVSAAKRGSHAAFGLLVEQHQQAVRGFLRRLGHNYADADDLAQETFVTAWTRIDLFRQKDSLRAWLCGIAYRKWLTHRRAETRRRARDTAVAKDEPLAIASSAEARIDAAAALGALPMEQRAAVALCLAAEFSHQEAAKALGLPLGTVKSHVARARAKLIELLGGADD